MPTVMDFAAGLPVCSQSYRVQFEIYDIRSAKTDIRIMGDNLKIISSNRKQGSNLRKQILLLVYDAKKLLKEEFSYMQSEVYRVQDDIAKFNALVNLTVDGDIIQVFGCPLSTSLAPEADRIRQWPWALFLDKFLWNRKDNAYKLYGQYADLCDTFEKYRVSWRCGASVTTDWSRFTGQPFQVPGVEEGLFSLPAAVSR